MDDALREIYRACVPDKPAPPEYYTDCGEARGQSALATRFLGHLQGASSSADNFVRFLFSGHIGCGKSSELLHLCHLLENPEPPVVDRYLPILLDAHDYLDDYDVTLTDILLATVTEVAATVRAKLSYELKDSYFKTRFDEIKTFLLSDVELNKAEFELLGAKLEMQRLKRNPDARQQVRDKLKPQSSRMLE